MGRIYHRSIKYLACSVDNRKLTAGAVARIKTDSHLIFDWRLHEKLMQIQRKQLDRFFVRIIGECCSYFALY